MYTIKRDSNEQVTISIRQRLTYTHTHTYTHTPTPTHTHTHTHKHTHTRTHTIDSMYTYNPPTYTTQMRSCTRELHSTQIGKAKQKLPQCDFTATNGDWSKLLHAK